MGVEIGVERCNCYSVTNVSTLLRKLQKNEFLGNYLAQPYFSLANSHLELILLFASRVTPWSQQLSCTHFNQKRIYLLGID